MKSLQHASAYRHVLKVVHRGYSVESQKSMGAYVSTTNWNKSDSEGFVASGKSKCRLLDSSPTYWHFFSNKGVDEHAGWSSHLSLHWEELLQSNLFFHSEGVIIYSACWYACGELASLRCCFSLSAETHLRVSRTLSKYTIIPIMTPPCRCNCLRWKPDGVRVIDW